MKEMIMAAVCESISAKKQFFENKLSEIMNAADTMAKCFVSGHKLLVFGNGGSAADAQHMAAELVNRFRIERSPLPAVALTTDTSIITSIGNDYSFDDIFSKQILALGLRDDIAIGISTSGNSANVVKAIEVAQSRGLYTIGLSGPEGNLAALVDLPFCVESKVVARIQEVHITLIHVLCDLIERILFPGTVLYG
jgi:D-sedoheptulose 7-phosphate isomerase